MKIYGEGKMARKQAIKRKSTKSIKKGLPKAAVLRKGKLLSNWGTWGPKD